MAQTWNAAGYDRHGRFVADLAALLLQLLDAKPGERILDLGCGDGALTEKLAAAGASVLGVDSSPELLAAAAARGLEVELGDGARLRFRDEFDAVFSNAALHWMRDQAAVLGGVRAALRMGGRFVAEMGGHGNVAAIRAALQAVFTPLGIDAEEEGGNVFFTPAEYEALLGRHGFQVDSMELVPRPTPLPTGIEGWLATFRQALFAKLHADQRAHAVEQVSRILQPILRDRNGVWHADYVRLRFAASAV